MTQAAARQAIALARANQHLGRMASSAEVAAADAFACYLKADCRHAYERACCSLAYSVGLFGTAYQQARGLGSPRPLTID